MIGRASAFWNPQVIRYWPPSVPYPKDSRCAHCHEVRPLDFVRSMTAYHWDGKTGPDPNPDMWMCRECADHYCEFWQEQWDEYHAGLL